METVSPAVTCYEFDCSISGFINLDEYLEKMTDEDTGSHIQD